MAADDTLLVIGGNSLVGGGLFSALKRRGFKALATTRRTDEVSESDILLDFERPETFRVPSEITYAFVVAAATDYTRCETDPLAHTINVELIPQLVESLLEQGIFVAFVSTNSVFGGEIPWPHEDTSHQPGIAYAQQKAEGEARIVEATARLGAQHRLAIIRLTKILERRTPPIPTWLEVWERGELVTPFRDLIFAPMSVEFVSESLAALGKSRVNGNLHLSGAENVDYVAFASAIATHCGIDLSLIGETTATEKGVRIAFKPTYSGLGMERTTLLTGVKPQPLSSVINDLFAV